MAVRFADISGNGRADYLCISKNGKVMGHVQGDDGVFEKGLQIKTAEEADRANLRYVHVIHGHLVPLY